MLCPGPVEPETRLEVVARSGAAASNQEPRRAPERTRQPGLLLAWLPPAPARFTQILVLGEQTHKAIFSADTQTLALPFAPNTAPSEENGR